METGMTRAEILGAAKEAVCVDRNATHGEPEDSFRAIAALWTAYLSRGGRTAVTGVNPADVAAMMALLKIARSRENQANPDNWVDLAGYAACGAEVAT